MNLSIHVDTRKSVTLPKILTPLIEMETYTKLFGSISSYRTKRKIADVANIQTKRTISFRGTTVPINHPTFRSQYCT